ncbi:MAG: antibiotic biosynthesis monooxygenase [Hyphomonas sp.]
MSGPGASLEAEAGAGLWALCVTFSIKPDHAGEFVEIVSAVIDEMRHEPNFVSTTLCRDPELPGRFFLFETWKSRAWFIAEDMTRTYRQPYEARLAEIQLADRQVQEWRQVRADFRFSVKQT